MNMSVTEFVVPPAIVGRNRSVWREIIDAVMEGAPERLRTKSPNILHGISTTYHRCCELSLSVVTYAHKRGLRRRGDRPDVEAKQRYRASAQLTRMIE
jgi:hypothetical protein